MNKVCVRTLLMTPEMTWHSGGLMPCLAFCIIPFARSVIKNENKIRQHILPHVSILEGTITQFCEVICIYKARCRTNMGEQTEIYEIKILYGKPLYIHTYIYNCNTCTPHPRSSTWP